MNTENHEAAPIDEFSNCHSGILAHLHELATLPALLEPAAQSRRVATHTLSFFRKVVFEHHAEEEQELFPRVLSSATQGDERARVQAMVTQLTAEHRRVEAAWSALEPQLKAVAKGRETTLASSELTQLVDAYLAHARYEETVFLPLAKTILGRNANHMAALGLSMHLRHAVPAVLERLGSRI